MRILDVNDNELQEEDIDLELGHLDSDRLFVQHHDAIAAQPRRFHYAVKAFYFKGGTSEIIENENDPRVGVDDAAAGRFHFVPQSADDTRELQGIDLREVEDSPKVDAREAWDEYEEIQRYILYTQEELEERAAAAEAEARREELLSTGLDRIEATEGDVEDLILIMADIVGAEE